MGVDKVPFAYYRSKLATEQLIETSLLPWSIVRTTQFHDLIFRGCKALARPPVMLLPAGLVFQPIEVREVAERLVELAQAPPAGRAPDMGGPELQKFRDLARQLPGGGWPPAHRGERARCLVLRALRFAGATT